MLNSKPGGFLERAQQWMTPERAIAMQGIGQGISQLAQGQPANLSGPMQMLAQRQQRADARRVLEESGVMSRFTPEQRAMLSQMEPGAAQKIIASALFAPAPAPTKGVEINGQLVNPVTGQVIGDYRTPEDPGPTGYIATGEQAAALGLDPQNSYNVTVDGGVIKATQIGGGGATVNITQGTESDVWGDAPKDHVWLRDEAGNVLTEADPSGRGQRPIAVPIGGTPAAVKASETQSANDSTILEAENALGLISSIMNDPALSSVTGNVQGRLPAGIPGITGGQEGADLGVKIQQLQGKAFLQAFETLKGGGQITEREGIAAQNAIARLQTVQSTEEYLAALKELEQIVSAGLARARGQTVDDTADPLGILE